jgi:hypothetical protein
MTIVTQDTGASSILNARFNNIFPTSKDLTLILFCNDIVPIDTHELSDYIEPTGGGYASKTLTCGSWTVSIVSGIAQAEYAQQVFTFTGPLNGDATIYGYVVKDDDDNLVFSELLDEPCTPVANGNHVDITIVYRGSKGVPS